MPSIMATSLGHWLTHPPLDQKMTPGPDINPFSVLADEMDNMPPTHPYVTLLKNYKKRKTTNRYRTNQLMKTPAQLPRPQISTAN